MSEQLLDRLAYEALDCGQPHIIKAIKACLAEGGTPQFIEAKLRERFGETSASVNMVIHAAYYLAGRPEERDHV